MGETDSLWGYQENHEMEQLGQKLLCTTLELESLKAEAMSETDKNKEYIKQLILLLRYAVQERDEARNELHKLLNNPLFLDHSPLVRPGNGNSGVAESNSPSDAYAYRSHSSSPVESLFNDMASPTINLPSNQRLPQDSHSQVVGMHEHDLASVIIDNIAKGRVLPEKGSFLQAIRQTGPLLQTLLVAGPLPRWRNPPQIQPVQIPPVSISGCDALFLPQKREMNGVGGMAGLRSLDSHPHAQIPSVGPNLVMLNGNGYNNLGKRQRFI